MDNCLFCRIARHELDSGIVFENDDVICFKDIHPVAPVHVLLMPKKHFEDIITMASSGEEGKKAMNAVLAAIPEIAVLCGVAEDGFRIINNSGVNGGQTVPHVHFHLIGGKKLGAKLF
ncbi:MAG: HIT domain-containing protein [Saccharofermentanales bacterium]